MEKNLQETLENMKAYAKKHKVGSIVKAKPFTRKSLLENIAARDRIKVQFYKRCGKILEAIYPNDNRSGEDIAFGILTNGEILDVTDFKDLLTVEPGYISHLLMLVAKGYAKDENDAKPKYDYRIRGIIKPEMDGAVVFWETPSQLLEKRNFEYLKKILKRLKQKNLIKDSAEVYGAGTHSTTMGTVEDLLKMKG